MHIWLYKQNEVSDRRLYFSGGTTGKLRRRSTMNSRSRLAAFRNFGLSLGLPRFHPFFPPHFAMSRPPPGLPPLSFPSSYQLLPHPRHHHHHLLPPSSFPTLPQELLIPRMALPQEAERWRQEQEEERGSPPGSPPGGQQQAGSSYLGQEGLLLLRARVMSTPGGRVSSSPPPPASSRFFIKAEPDLTE